jgi:hypothetical protein
VSFTATAKVRLTEPATPASGPTVIGPTATGRTGTERAGGTAAAPGGPATTRSPGPAAGEPGPAGGSTAAGPIGTGKANSRRAQSAAAHRAASRWNALSIAAVVSIVTWTPLPLVLGILALRQVREYDQRGRRLAITGIVAGTILLLVYIYVFAFGF